MSIITSKTITNIVNNKKVQKAAASLTAGGALLPVVLLESSVLIGRTHQAFKRGGAIEGKERLTEETISSVGWLAGIPVLNKAGDFAIDKILKATKNGGNIDFSIGKDAIRNPMQDALSHMAQKQKNLLMGLKLGKIVASSLATVYFMGMILPKVLHKKTEQRVKELQNSTPQSAVSNYDMNKSPDAMFKGERKSPAQAHQVVSIENFLKQTNPQKNQNNSKNPSFGGFDTVANTILYNMENNHIVNLLTVDAGLFAGRVHNARNIFEKIEILFRDCSSSFFYVAATPLIVGGLQKIDPLKGKNTRLDPTTVDKFTNLITNPVNKEIMDWRNMDEIPLETFKKGLLGSYLVDKKVYEKSKSLNEGGIVTLKKLSKFIDSNVTDKNLAQSIKENALNLSKLQPQKAGESILTPTQLKSVFKDGILNDGKIINDLVDSATSGKALDHTKFISQKKVDAARKHVIDYAQSILEQAKKENLCAVTPEFLQKMKNRNMMTKFGFWGVGMLVSAAFLSTIIPKTQNFISKKLSKQDGFVGTLDESKIAQKPNFNKKA